MLAASVLQDFARQWHLLPGRGRELAGGLERHLSGRDWDMAERALHAVQSIAATAEGPHLLQVLLRPLAGLAHGYWA
jgi:hypothetical protein